MTGEGPMTIESDYRGYRIEVIAFEIEGGWDVRNTLSEQRIRV